MVLLEVMLYTSDHLCAHDSVECVLDVHFSSLIFVAGETFGVRV